METEVESDDECLDLAAGIVAVNLFGSRKANMRAQWVNAYHQGCRQDSGLSFSFIESYESLETQW